MNCLLLQYDLKLTVNIPTRVTKNMATLLDVVLTNEEKSINSLRVINLGLSDHQAQILTIPISDSRIIPYRIEKRYFSESNLQEFFSLIKSGYLARLMKKRMLI